jgi:uncharacterized iron-regulated membrane protein
MKGSLTQSMSWLHTWCGLLIGWVLFAIFLTGTLAVFDKELNWWMQPELIDQGQAPAAAADVAQQWLTEHHSDESKWTISLPTERAPGLAVSVGERRRGGGSGPTHLDPLTGETVAARQTIGGNFFFHFHYTLHMPRLIGIWLVGFAAMAMLVALISGIIIHKKIFKEFFTFRPAKGQRSWLDAHNASAVLLLPFHLMITYTGLVIFFLIYMPAAIDALYDGDSQAFFSEAQPTWTTQQALRGEGPDSKPVQASAAPLRPLGEIVSRAEAHYGEGMIGTLAISNPGRSNAFVTAWPVLGNRIELTKGDGILFNGVTGEVMHAPEPSRTSQLTQRVMAGLHFAQFGGYSIRWLYFICGLVSCAMIATGLVLYTVKQRKQAKVNAHFLRVAEALNVTVVAGLALACVSLLWANRLLPAELAARQDWELRAFFGIWALSGLHAWLRKPLHAWREQLSAAALLGVMLPLLSLLTTDAAFDVTRLITLATVALLGLLCGWTAWKIPTVVAARKARAARLDSTVAGASS